ncbi:MAG: M20/M25/M40 family metallo-hydrolase [Candidatus Rhabdochlamydia sp.]
MKNNPIFELLQLLINAKGPCGEEDEIRAVCKQKLQPLVDEMWVDAAGNLIGKIIGSQPDPLQSVNLMVHMDELSLIVKRINEDGSLRVNPLGAIYPFNFGQGPVEIMGDKKQFSGILSFGCMHITKETPAVNKMIPEEYRGLGKSPAWEDVVIITRMTVEELKEAGVHPGTRVVIGKSLRQLHYFQDCIAGYFLDNRASIAIALTALKQIKDKNKKPKKDIYFVATCSEEMGAHGASYAARTLSASITLAIDVGPVAKEYNTVLSPSPIIVYQDAIALYDKKICDQMVSLGKNLGLTLQRAVFGSYGSDASLAYSRGQSAKAGLLCFPVENTHGYEIAHKDSLNQCADLLEAYLCD